MMNRESYNFSGDRQDKKPETEFPNLLNLANRIFKLPLQPDYFSEADFSETVVGKIMLLREQTLTHPEALLQEGFINVLRAFEKALDEDMVSKKEKDPEILKKRNVFYNEYVEPVLKIVDKIDPEKPKLRYQIKVDLKKEFSQRRQFSPDQRASF